MTAQVNVEALVGMINSFIEGISRMVTAATVSVANAFEANAAPLFGYIVVLILIGFALHSFLGTRLQRFVEPFVNFISNIFGAIVPGR